MKKILIALFVFLITNLFVSIAQADVIFEGTHPVNKCVKIINSLDFPQYYVVGYLEGPMVTISNYVVRPSECLTKGYKFTTLSIYLADRNYIDSIGVENFNPSTTTSNKSFYLLSNQIEPYGGYVTNNNTITEENVEYTLVKSSNGELELQKTKDVSAYGLFPSIDFFKALLLTILIELPILFIFLRKIVSYKKILTIGLLTNVLSLYILWYVLKRFLPINNYLLVGEGIVFIIEAVIYKIIFKISNVDAISVSLIANVLSWFIGFIYFGSLFM